MQLSLRLGVEMDLNWQNLCDLGRGFLRLLDILTRWPIVLSLLAIWLAKKFEPTITWILKNSRLGFKAGAFSADIRPQEKPIDPDSSTPGDVPASQSVAADPGAGAAASSGWPKDKVLGLAERHGDVAALEKELEVVSKERDEANRRSWQAWFQYLEAWLVPLSKSVLYWLNEKEQVELVRFDALISSRSHGIGDGESIRRALYDSQLIVQRDGMVHLEERAKQYIKWRNTLGLGAPIALKEYLVRPEMVVFSKININEPYEAAFWSEAFGVSIEELRHAIIAVGPSAFEVDKYLKGSE